MNIDNSPSPWRSPLGSCRLGGVIAPPPRQRVLRDGVAARLPQRAYRALFDREPKIDKWTFSTNAVTITGMYNIPTVGFGPGNEVLAHAPNEKVPIDDLVKASAFYAMYAYMI